MQSIILIFYNVFKLQFYIIDAVEFAEERQCSEQSWARREKWSRYITNNNT